VWTPDPGITIREAETIWREQGGWFDARWHFSFDRYRDPEQMGVGALRSSTTTGSSPGPSGRCTRLGPRVAVGFLMGYLAFGIVVGVIYFALNRGGGLDAAL
jgi:hypothetical protein